MDPSLRVASPQGSQLFCLVNPDCPEPRNRSGSAAAAAAVGESYDAPAAAPDAEQCLLAKEIGRRIAAAFARLPERQRVAFALCQIERMRNAAAAECLGVSVGALELLLVRARKTMHRELADLLEGDR